MIIKIDGIDKTNLVDWKSFEMINVLTKEVDTVSFKLRVHPGQTYTPEISKEITVWEGATKIYGGYIVEIEKRVEAMVQSWVVICKDYHYVLDRKLVYRSYSGQKAGDIVKDIISNFTTGFTTANVADGIEITKITFNYEQVSRAIQQIADRINYDWYVDENKDIHFFNIETNEAPFELNDTGGNLIWNSLQINKNINQVKNSIFVRGGMEALGAKTDKKVADGSQKVFNIGYSYDNFTVRKGGDVQTLGKDGVTDPASVDVLYNPDRAIIIFRDNNKPGNGVEVEWSGNAYMPVFAHVEDSESIAIYGEFQFNIIDKSITSNAEAKQRAWAELNKFRADANEIIFKTRKDGLKVGQKIRINSAILGIDKWFRIKRAITKVEDATANNKIYEISLIGSEKTGILDIFSKLLVTDPAKNVEIFEDEILYKYKAVSEKISILETISKKVASFISEIASVSEDVRRDPWGVEVAPTWVLGPYTPTGDDDPKRPIWCDRGAWVY